MGDRRIRRAQIRKDRADKPQPISAAERAALWQIDHGKPSNAAMRKRLASKGLIASRVASLAFITRAGIIALGRKPVDEIAAAPIDPQGGEGYWRWAQEHGVTVRKGCWG